MLHNLTGWHALIILAVVLLVFGSTKLPALAKSVGQSVRILKNETREAASENTSAPTASTAPAAPAQPVAPAQPYSPVQPVAGAPVWAEAGVNHSAS